MNPTSKKIWDINYPLKTYFDSASLKIFSTCASWPNIENAISKIIAGNAAAYFITMDWGDTFQYPQTYYDKFIPLKEKITFLSNDEITHTRRKKTGLNSQLINHNTWINEEVFRILKGVEKRYDAVLTARAKEWKRIFLASKIKNLALVINRWNISSHMGANDSSYLYIRSKFLNKKKLNKFELCELYNESRTGVILSAFEGASYTSSEYLLCGIPVVSNKPAPGKSLGGREFWYDDYNSIMCDATEAEVARSVEQLCHEGKNAQEIRNKTLERIKVQRELFLSEVLQKLFAERSIQINARDFFYETLFDSKTGECSLKSEGHAVSIT